LVPDQETKICQLSKNLNGRRCWRNKHILILLQKKKKTARTTGSRSRCTFANISSHHLSL
jgi:hypothetical protein